jgi:hypothetical protein
MLSMKLFSAQRLERFRPSFKVSSGRGFTCLLLAPHLVFVTGLAEVIRSVPRFRNFVLQIYAHDRRGKDERSRLDPLMTECPADQQISWTQLLVFPVFQAWYNGPVFEFDRSFLCSHAVSSLIFWMRTT